MIQRKTITISRDVRDIYNFDVQFANINFVPDEVIVKNVLLVSPTTANDFCVYSDLVGDILFFTGASDGVFSSSPNTSFIPRGANGQWNFSLREPDQVTPYQPGPLEVCTLYFQLEFIKYNN
jgi:hypothetical protein